MSIEDAGWELGHSGRGDMGLGLESSIRPTVHVVKLVFFHTAM